ncbi:acyltransferase family protein [Pseudoduganella rhizocola]|uniref:acyltransferase family protein n=1 Tax=Pseudoduganella rhizocola TaxID=3382643 RepID=UPI0038B580FC
MKGVAGGAAAVAPPQFGLINVLKAGAAQLIVLHHLAFYGPMADRAGELFPDLVGWLASDARIAVQVFLVIGGFLAAKSLAPAGHAGLADPLGALWQRYLKLAPPFFAATLLAAAAGALAAQWMTHESISAPATVGQLAAHALLLHDVLGYPALSAGAWYVAIDFQLYAMAVLMAWGAGLAMRPRALLLPLIAAAGVILSLLHFNLDPDWDNWGLYFFGSYGLGMLAWWAGDARRPARAALLLAALIVLSALLALLVEFRSRIALALLTACLLLLWGRVRTHAASAAWPAVNALARSSYSVFLVHFPVCLVVNAAFTRFAPPAPEWQALGMLLAWGASVTGGALFYRVVEAPLAASDLMKSRKARSGGGTSLRPG